MLTNLSRPIASVALDADGDGTPDFGSTTLPETIPFTYAQPGLYHATMTITDDQGVIYTATININVMSLTELDALLKSKWEGMKAALVNGDIETALTYFTSPVQERYRLTFNQFKDKLPIRISNIEAPHLLNVSDILAEAELIRTRHGVRYSYPITFVKDRNGLWKIQTF